MTVSKFLTYWSLLFGILTIWGFSILVALGDVKDELRDAFRRRWAGSVKSKLAFTDPLAGQTTAETLTTRPMTESQAWVLGEVAPIAERLGLGVRTLVLQDTFGHYVVYLSQGKRLVTYRLDRQWVDGARAGKADQLDRIRQGVERYLRREFLGEVPAPAAPAAPPPPAPPTATAGPAEMSREERIAAAKAKAEAIKAQRGASGEGGSEPPPAGPAPAAAEMSREEQIAAAKAKAEAIKAQRDASGESGAAPPPAAPAPAAAEMSREERIAAAKAKAEAIKAQRDASGEGGKGPSPADPPKDPGQGAAGS